MLLISLTWISGESMEPYWLNEIPDSESFIYFRGIGVSTNDSFARQLSIADAISSFSHYNDLQVSSKIRSHEYSESYGNEYFEYDRLSKDITLIGAGSDVKGLRVVDEYVKSLGDEKQYYVLVRYPKSLDYLDLPVYRKRSVAPMLKSIIVPGWGQFSKHDNKKAYYIISGTGLALLSTLTFKVVGDTYYQKSLDNSLSYAQQSLNRENADRAYIYANVSLIMAGVVYLYNVIDAIATNDNPEFSQVMPLPELALRIGENDFKISCMVTF